MKMHIRFCLKKNSNMHLMKMQIYCFFKEKFKSTSDEDADLFYLRKNLDLHLRKMQIYFYFKKNSDLHLRKMQICFYLSKSQIYI